MAEQGHGDSFNKAAKDMTKSAALRTDVNFSEDDISDEAKCRFAFHSTIVQNFQRNARVAVSNQRTSPIGRHLYCKMVEKDFKNFANVVNYAAIHPEVLSSANVMPPLLILCGAARTGSTLLYNLLACDPVCRAPTYLDIVYPVPPIARNDTDAQEQRKKMASAEVNMFRNAKMIDYEKEKNASHPTFEYEEDTGIFYQTGFVVPNMEPLDSTELETWFYNESDKDSIYEYHKLFMHMLNSVDAPRSHWVLKSPYHTFNLNTLLRCYPTALLVMTHRQLHDLLPSSIRLGLAYGSIFCDGSREDAETSKNIIQKRRLQTSGTQLKRIVEFRRTHPEISVFDIVYDDLMAKPIDTVRRLYDHFGLTWSEEFEQAMVTWLQENPQGKQGRHSYSLEEYGLTRDTLDQQYEEYNRMFLNSYSSSQIHDTAARNKDSTPNDQDSVAANTSH